MKRHQIDAIAFVALDELVNPHAGTPLTKEIIESALGKDSLILLDNIRIARKDFFEYVRGLKATDETV